MPWLCTVLTSPLQTTDVAPPSAHSENPGRPNSSPTLTFYGDFGLVQWRMLAETPGSLTMLLRNSLMLYCMQGTWQQLVQCEDLWAHACIISEKELTKLLPTPRLNPLFIFLVILWPQTFSFTIVCTTVSLLEGQVLSSPIIFCLKFLLSIHLSCTCAGGW